MDSDRSGALSPQAPAAPHATGRAAGVTRSRIVGIGSYLPERVMSNHDLAAIVDTSDEWVRQRTGIVERRVIADGQKTSDMGLAAARAALEQAGLSATQLDAIIVATTTPDQTFPATAATIQAALGCPGIPAFDLQAVCSGFVYGLGVADALIVSGQARTILLIGADAMTRILDWSDRGTCVLFADGAGAVVLRAEAGAGTAADHGILATRLHSDGRHAQMLYVDGGAGSTGTSGHIRMQGKEVFRHAVVNLAGVVAEVAQAAGVDPASIDWLVPHQANRRILSATAEKLGLPEERVVVTVDRHGNTSAASIPLALDEAVRDGRIRPGQLVVLEAMGGGFTWGASLVRW